MYDFGIRYLGGFMNKEAILHIPESQYAFAYTDCGSPRLRLRLRTAVGEDATVEVIYAVKYDWLTDRKRMPMVKRYTDERFDYYTASLDMGDSRMGYIFWIQSGEEGYFYSEAGLTKEFNQSKAYYSFFQYPYANEADVHKGLGWAKDAVAYQIFVDRFSQGDLKKDCSYINKEWGALPQADSFYGGDLKGIENHLDYLSDLGVNCIYLTPLFVSPSNHKYDTIDYYHVDEAFGGDDALKDLVAAAHEKGIRIILDAVFNHCSDRCEPFMDVMKKGRRSPYFDWFIIKGDYPDQEQVNYECFAACSYMPKWNTSNRAVQRYLIDVGLYWIKQFGIDGWRLDVADEVSHTFWRAFRQRVKEANLDAILIGESWHDARAWLMGDQFDSVMNYSFTKACLDYFASGTMNTKDFCNRLSGILMRNSDQVNEMMFNLLDSHDTERFLTNAGGDERKLILALCVLFFFVGIPCVYYGTEIGTAGEYDPDSRRCFDWEQSHWKVGIRDTVKALAKLKRDEIRGGIELLHQGEVLIVKRDGIALAVNPTEQALSFHWEGSIILLEENDYKILR
jgi:glycosidase